MADATPPPASRSSESRAPDTRPVVVVKKYANRRLYNTETSSYVTLEDLAAMVRQGRDFTVSDAKSGEDITRPVLTQIIVEEEAKGTNLLPIPFLRQLIGLYGDSLGAVVPRYLEATMSHFARQQEGMRRAAENALGTGMGSFGGYAALEELGKQNLAMFERAMSLFSPFPRGGAGGGSAQNGSVQGGGTGQPDPAATGDLEAMRAEIASLRRELAELRAAEAQPRSK